MTYELMPDVPAGKTVVSESGISHQAELEELERVGVDAVLIGEALMRAPDAESKTVSWRPTTRTRASTHALIALGPRKRVRSLGTLCGDL